jgi:oligopeptide/dipeptide ABC transporter ATP-binding protein
MADLLRIEGLKTFFFLREGTVKAVDGIDLSVGEEEILGIVGESASGKSVTALSILRLVQKPPGRIVGGKILFEGENLLEKDEKEMREIRGAKISMIFQDPMSSLNPVFTVGNQVAEAIRVHKGSLSKSKMNEEIGDIFKKVGIPDAPKRLNQYPHQFSGGMRQRVMIAMALSCHPQILIADEPTTNLDVTIQLQVLRLIKNVKEEFKSSVLLITHDMGVVAEMADKVAVMYAGRIMEYADVYEIFENPKHPYTKALLLSVPRLDVNVERLSVIPGTIPDPLKLPEGCRFSPRCEYANESCKKESPNLIEIEPGHLVACSRVEQI